MPQNRFELVIFDCDGVLVDSEPLAALAYRNIYAQQGLSLPDGTIAQCIGLKQADIIARVAELTGLQLADGAETGLWPETKRIFAESLQPTPGIVSFLEGLETAHCVASGSSLERIRFSLEITGLARFFGDAVYSSFMVKRGKPAPDLFLFAAEKMQADPAKCVVIEDSPFGVEGAVAAGMTAIGYTGGTHTHEDHAPALIAKGASAVFSDWNAIGAWMSNR
ncbi:HAD family phosphatase [Phyllobacterium sp. UNC302MFCol5.2]|uniref:HAD family hydrolase n=1 Tax=Phyllobacterium sp. UNC302MFCol5.2 TaxID=1449065 RepID=UPI00048687D7|nr:HAD family phosphatase [Phyllobacterium sp. UNC302MFCol5.2]